MFKIVDAETGEALGSVGFWEREWQGQQVYETGWGVLPEFQGCGIASRATALVIELARQEGKHDFLHAYPSAENGASNAICRKLAFTLLGEHEFEYPPGNRMRCNDWRLELRATPEHAAGGEAACLAHLLCPDCGVVLDGGAHRPGCVSAA